MTVVYFNLPADDLAAVDFLADRDEDGNRSEVLRHAVHDYLHREQSADRGDPSCDVADA